MSDKKIFYVKLGVFIFLLLWLGVFMAEKIDLATADLGRHIKNGEWVVNSGFNLHDKNSPLFENFYSYTNQDFPVVNHHWGSGVLFYLIYKLGGFSGLSLFYIFLSIVSFGIFFVVAKRESNFTVAAVLSILLIPLMAERREIRPEVFSCFFAAFFLWTLWSWHKKELANSRLYALPLLMVLWVNSHVYFFLGLFLIGTYWLQEMAQFLFAKLSDEEFLEKVRGAKNLTVVLVLSVLAALVNPFGWKGLVYPLQIFRNYGYTIVENKSVWFVENYGITNSNFMLIKAILVLMILSFVLIFIINKKKISIPYLIFAIFFGTIGWLAIRNFTLLGFFALPVLALNFENIFTPNQKDNLPAKENGIAVAFIAIAMIAIFANYKFISLHSGDRGIGLLPGNEAAAEFIKKENIKGPIFNNYDIGGYLVWSLPENEKVFVDNRPEAYPDSFFSQVYKPMQGDMSVFKKVYEKYNFNAIVFSRNDITPWGMNFLKVIRGNSNWGKVFEDDYAIVFVKK
ncbi:MAG: hypothetical protein Q8L09_01210 [Candidatus Moranbacteria bacterium]|nr:hypothetical protein [Candidatus Moranbacteria bacterium]